MQPHKPGVEGSGENPRAEHQSFSVLPGWTRIPRAHAYTWQMMAWAMNKRNYMNTSVQEPPLDYSFRSIHVTQGQQPEHGTPLTMATGWVWSLGRNQPFL